jgi:RHS repeat-associated protein
VREFYSFTTAGVLDRVDPGADFRATDPTSGGGPSSTGSGVAARGKPENLARLANLTAGEHTAEAGVGSASEAVVGVDLDGTLVTRVGRTQLHYDACGRVVRTVTKRLSRKPLVREFVYGATGQVRGFSCSDEPGYWWVYVYDGLARRVAKEKNHTSSGEVVQRVMFVHDGDSLVGEQITVDSPNHQPGHAADHGASRVNDGRVWVTDPATGEFLGQISLTTRDDDAASPATTTGPATGRWSTPAAAATASQRQVDAVFHAMVTDLASAPRELINPETGQVAGRVEQSLYGRRTWHGDVTCPLLFAGQYQDAESGWVYNRFRYYDPTVGVYGAQDPLGVALRLAGAQGYINSRRRPCTRNRRSRAD